jgi:hypothetical protein
VFTRASHSTLFRDMNPIHTLTPHVLQIHCNIILPSTPRTPKIPLPLWFSTIILCYTSRPFIQLKLRKLKHIRLYLKTTLFWDIANCPDDGGSKNVWNDGQLVRDYKAQYPRRLSSSYSPLWEPEISITFTYQNVIIIKLKVTRIK